MNPKICTAFLFCFAFSFSFLTPENAQAALSLDDGMTLLWNFDEVERTGLVRDRTGNGNDATVAYMTHVTTAEKSPTGYSFLITNNLSASSDQIGAVYTTNLTAYADSVFSRADWTFFCRFESPAITGSGSLFLARAASTVTNNAAVAWNINVMPTNATYKGQLRISFTGEDGFTCYTYPTNSAWNPGTWYSLALVSRYENGAHRFLMYMAPDGETSFVKPILDYKRSELAALAPGNTLILGAALNGENVTSTRAYGGSIRSRVDDTAFWVGKALSLEQLDALLPKAQAPYAVSPSDLESTVHYTFDEEPAETTDSSIRTTRNTGNSKYDGVVRGNVKGGSFGGFDFAYSGFTGNTSFVACTNLPCSNATSPNTYTAEVWTFIGYYRIPKEAPETDALLVRGSKNNFGRNSDNPWSLYLTPEQNPVLALQNWNGKQTNFVADASLDLKPGEWMQVAVRRTLKNSWPNYEVFMTPSYGQTLRKVMDVAWPSEAWGAGKESNGQSLVIGGGEKGYYATQTAGYWNGEIDDIRFFYLFALPEEMMLESLKSFSPPFYSIILFR
ncbi:MAG: hypothetical protein ACI4QT_04070 [Kiritimatiellia bacterium]